MRPLSLPGRHRSAPRAFLIIIFVSGFLLAWAAGGGRASAAVWIKNPLETEEQGIRLSGEKLIYSTPEHRYTVEGNAFVEGTGWSVRADRLTFDPESLVLKAEGHVSIQDQTSKIDTERLELNLRDNTGFLFQGKMELLPGPGDEGRFQLEGEVISRSSPLKYHIERGSFTTCSCPKNLPLPWKMGCRKADLTIGEYVRFRGFVFRVFNLPVFYSPWLIYPVKTQRQTGFLMPRFYYSERDGFQAEDSFFINISPSLDATLGAKVLTNRGLQGSGQFRYRLVPGFPEGYAGGELNVSYLGELFKPEAERNEWYTLTFRHEHDVTPRDWAGVDANLQSQRYPAEFGGNLQERSATYSSSNAFWRNRGDRLLTVAEANYLYNLQSTAPEIHRLPHLTLELVDLAIPKTPLRFYGPVSFVSFTNLQGQAAAAPRFNLFPRLLVPLSLFGVAGFSGQAGLEEVASWVKPGDFNTTPGGGRFHHQTAFAGEAKIETGWERAFLSSDGSGFQHQIAAEAGYSERDLLREDQILIATEAGYPDPTMPLEDRVLAFDELDLIGDRRYLPYRLETELAYRSRPGATRGRLRLEAQEFYDLREEEFSDVLSRISLNWDSWEARASGIYNFRGKGLSDVGASVNLPLVPGILNAGLGYRKIKEYNETLDPRGDLNRVWLSDFLNSEYGRESAQDLTGRLSLSLFRHINFSGEVNFSLKEKAFREGIYNISYLSFCDCYLLNFRYIDRTGFTNDLFSLMITFTGFGGEIKQP